MAFKNQTIKRYSMLIGIALFTPMLTSCLVSTALETFAMVFGQNLISTASHNYSPRYGDQVEELLYAMAADTKKAWKENPDVRHEATGDQQMYYANNNDGQQSYYDNQGGGQQNYYADQGSGQQVYYVDQSSNQQDYYGDQGGNQQDYYVDQSSNQQDYYGDQGGNQQDYYVDQNNDQQYYQDAGYNQLQDSQQNYIQASYQQPSMSLDVDILVQRMTDSGEAPPVPIQDGDILYSVQGDPKAGDKIKLSFKSTCDCYIYIVGIDATGYVASVFPDPDSNLSNPVKANRGYLVPGGTEWYGLDDYKGVEQIYFIASYTRRLDLERITKALSGKKRIVPPDYQQVKIAAVIPKTRGIVKVDMGSSTMVQASNGSVHSFKPSTFIANSQNADLVITRWFNHH